MREQVFPFAFQGSATYGVVASTHTRQLIPRSIGRRPIRDLHRHRDFWCWERKSRSRQPDGHGHVLRRLTPRSAPNVPLTSATGPLKRRAHRRRIWYRHPSDHRGLHEYRWELLGLDLVGARSSHPFDPKSDHGSDFLAQSFGRWLPVVLTANVFVTPPVPSGPTPTGTVTFYLGTHSAHSVTWNRNP